ncbi:hypothetical protein [Desulfolucanica intricata]|uniref:hypothetical protein n=1 Tax=Desulfolucanica intricata TaxID=1285191 RepID=UPI000A6DB8F6|nr:hypothetical protein [Desulfolucanica intricata]
MADGQWIILPTETEVTAALTTPIGDHLVKKMIQAYEGSFAKGIVPAELAMGKEQNNLL